jgi:hypothetical protein
MDVPVDGGVPGGAVLLDAFIMPEVGHVSMTGG